MGHGAPLLSGWTWVMASLRRLYAGLKLRVNEAKSRVARATARKFLGFSFRIAPGRKVKRRVAPEAIKRMKETVREITRRSAGRSLAQVCETLGAYLAGWKACFRIAETPRVFAALDRWLRHRLRAVQLKHGKRGARAHRPRHARPRCPARRCQRAPMVAQRGHGAPPCAPERTLRPARRSQAGRLTSTLRTARCGPACRVVWQGTRRIRAPRPYADRHDVRGEAASVRPSPAPCCPISSARRSCRRRSRRAAAAW